MKATEARLLDFLKRSPQFVIPIYQRAYAWTEQQCDQLWRDILETGRNDARSAHFVGSIVYVERGIYQVSAQSALLVIDGQQRLTTLTLILEALARTVGEQEVVEGFSAHKIRNYFLLNPLEAGEKKYKLLLSETDRDSLLAIIERRDPPLNASIRIGSTFDFFADRLADAAAELEVICRGLSKLTVVDIALNRDQDNPQLIFESLNSTGLDLSQADLIRNFILMGLDTQLQAQLYEQHWRPMELEFGQEAYATTFDAFMRHYLTVKTGEIPNLRDVYDAFKRYARDQQKVVQELVQDIHTHARYFCAMALGHEDDTDLKSAFQDIQELRVDVALPLLLELYRDYDSGALSKADLLHAARLIEAYVFRRVVCGIPTASMNKTLATFAKSLKKDRYLESVRAIFQTMPSYRRFPDDAEFAASLQQRDLYNFRSRSYWLRRLENHDRKERVSVGEYTIEHILPQNESLSQQWKSDLGPEWERIQKTYLHTLGNLTLTGYNSEYSDRPFGDKRDMKGGFRESPLRLNAGLGDLHVWNEEAIRARAASLAAQAVRVWSSPGLESAVLGEYRPRPKPTVYSISDHPHLMGAMSSVFSALRKELIALDPCVVEEFLKLYVAYKAETNFVDVIPQAKRLLLSLNINPAELVDPRGLHRDVSGLGRWGNGDVELTVKSTDEIPYVIGLARQVLERQLGSAAEN